MRYAKSMIALFVALSACQNDDTVGRTDETPPGSVVCLNDHQEQRLGGPYECGGYPCVPGEGCGKTCAADTDCRSGFVCLDYGKGFRGCSVPIP